MIRKNPYYTVIDSNGDEYWFLNGNLHRVDGPAIECSDGDKYWFLNGKRHRVDGPAVELSNGTKWWYLNDSKYTEIEYNKEINKLNKKINKES